MLLSIKDVNSDVFRIYENKKFCYFIKVFDYFRVSWKGIEFTNWNAVVDKIDKILFKNNFLNF